MSGSTDPTRPTSADPVAGDSIVATRRLVDEIDEDLVRLLARRERLLRTQPAASDPAGTLERVRNLALVHGLDPQVADQTWRSMLAGLARLELREQAGS